MRAYATRSKNKHHLPKCSVSKTTWATNGTNRQSSITSNKPKALRRIILGDNTPSPNALRGLKPATCPQCTTPAHPTKMTTKSMGGRADADRQNNLDITSKASCGEASRSVSVAKAILSAPSIFSSPRARACRWPWLFAWRRRRFVAASTAFFRRRVDDGVASRSTLDYSRCKPMHAWDNSCGLLECRLAALLG